MKIDLKDTDALNNKGKAYYNLKEYYKAIDCCDQVLQIDLKDAGALYNKGIAYFELKDY